MVGYFFSVLLSRSYTNQQHTTLINPLLISSSPNFLQYDLSVDRLPLVMFVATFVAGILPLKLTVAQHHLKYLSFLSMGILIGTAMMIILPEGIETISHETTDVALYVGFPILLGFLTMYILDCMFSTNVKAQESSVVESVVGSPITLGLIFHGIIDGISLGSSLASGEVMTLIIFAAIIIHKIPTSFSLSTILLQEGRQIQNCIGIFYCLPC